VPNLTGLIVEGKGSLLWIAADLSHQIFGFVVASAIGLVIFIAGLLWIWRRTVRIRGLEHHPLTRTRSINVDMNCQTALDIAARAVKGLGGKDIDLDREKGTVFAKLGISGRSWGQYLRIDVEQIGDADCSVECQTWPVVEPTAMDWGAGRLTLDRFAKKFVEMSAESGVQDES
jgi:hypothetical protein